MAKTPKHNRRKAVRRKAPESAQWWREHAYRATGVPTPIKPPGKTSEPEAAQLAGYQNRHGGPVPITYSPTPSIDPNDPRTIGAGYDPTTRTLRVEWGDGGRSYQYYDVPPAVWDAFRKTPSPGQFINSTLNFYRYGPI